MVRAAPLQPLEPLVVEGGLEAVGVVVSLGLEVEMVEASLAEVVEALGEEAFLAAEEVLAGVVEAGQAGVVEAAAASALIREQRPAPVCRP